MEYSVDPFLIYDITNKEVARSLVTNTPMIVSGEVVSKFLCSEVDKKIVIPRIIRGDVKEMFVGEIDIDRRTSSIRGKCRNEFGKDEVFLSLGC